MTQADATNTIIPTVSDPLRHRIETAIEALVALLDLVDGDDDLEPIDEREGGDPDREPVCEDEGAQCDDEGHDSDAEPSCDDEGWNLFHATPDGEA